MTNIPELLPRGISHTTDLDALSPAERRKHHTRQLRSIALHQGMDGVKAYKAQHPEAAHIRIQSAPVAYVPKPSGYGDAMAVLADGWFTSEAALAQTNRADVARLNNRLATDRFDPRNHFSKPLSASVKRKIAAVFAAHGAALDLAKPMTMTAVRKAVLAAKAGYSQGGAITRTDTTISVGHLTCPIQKHSGHDCIRVPVAGKRPRIRVDALLQLLKLAGLGRAGEVSDYLLHSSIGELAPNSETAPCDPLEFHNLPEHWPQDHRSPIPVSGALAPDPERVSLSDRISRLPRIAPKPSHEPNGTDPLALDNPQVTHMGPGFRAPGIRLA